METKYEYAVSACLCGEKVRYDGGCKESLKWKELYEQGKVLLICPECLGGLPIPREPSEIVGNRVMSKGGRDVTSNFQEGARLAMEMIEKYPSIHTIVLKEDSPSCGTHFVYDGSFSGKKVPGMGVFANLALEKGYHIINEEENEIK